MANYQDSVNLIVETSSSEEQSWLLRVFEKRQITAEDWSLLPPEDRKGRDPADLYTGCYAQDASGQWREESGVWITDYETACVDVIVLILRVFQMKFKKTNPIIVTWATQCSSPRLYSTTGGAVAIFNGVDWWFTPQEAAIAKIKQLGGTPVEDC